MRCDVKEKAATTSSSVNSVAEKLETKINVNYWKLKLM